MSLMDQSYSVPNFINSIFSVLRAIYQECYSILTNSFQEIMQGLEIENIKVQMNSLDKYIHIYPVETLNIQKTNLVILHNLEMIEFLQSLLDLTFIPGFTTF